ncbi:MAG: 2,3-diaminopropionate biosynthesis protein SbnA [Planctomycetota bacterium]
MNQTRPVSEGVLDAIGSTPLIRLRRYLDDPSIALYAKLESANPGGSAKDRPARLMIESALQSGQIGPTTTIIESSSGNMGIGLAQACRYYGLRFICVVDPLARPENVAIMRALGASIETVTAAAPPDYLAARLRRVCELLEADADTFWPNQYANADNPKSHTEGTIREIDKALGGELDHLFVATSSTGTAGGCQDYLRERGRHAEITAVDAEGSVLFGGVVGDRLIPGLGAGKEPPLAMSRAFHNVQRVTTLDCVVGCRRLADLEAMLVGGSAGGVLEAVRRDAPRLAGQTVVAVLHDSGTRYLSTIFDDTWVHNHLGVTPDDLQRLIRSDIDTGVYRT